MAHARACHSDLAIGFDLLSGQLALVVDEDRGVLLHAAVLVDGEELSSSEVVEITFDEPVPPDLFFRCAKSALPDAGSGEVVGEIPSAQLARLEADEQVVARGLGVLLAGLRSEVTLGYPADDRSVVRDAEAGPSAKLEAPVGRAVVVNDDARARVSTKVSGFNVVTPGHDVETVVVPLVPDRRKENRAVAPVRREDGDERQLQQVAEVVWCQPFAHSVFSCLR